MPLDRFHAEVWTWFLRGSGGKETHTFINELNVRVRGTIDPVQKIRVLVKEGMSIASPRVRAVETTRGRQKKQH